MSTGDNAFCGNCGTSIPAAARFCSNCGASQQPFGAPPAGGPGSTAVRDLPPPVPGPGSTAIRDLPQPPPAPPKPQFAPGFEPSAAGPPPPPPPPFAPPAAPAPPAAVRPPYSPAPPPGGQQPGPPAAPVDPSELVGQLVGIFRLPGVVAAGGAATIAAVVLFLAGLVAAIAFPDGSLIGRIGFDQGTVSEAFGQMCQFAGVAFDDERIAPGTLVLLPLIACAAAAYWTGQSTASMRPRARVIWGAATGIPFGLLMVVAALAAGDIDPSVGGSLLLGVLWGTVGGAFGAWRRVRRSTPEIAGTVVPPAAAPVLAAASAVLRPLGFAIAITAVLGVVVWGVQTIRDEGEARANRTLGVALVENSLGALDHGVHFAELGATAKFRNPAAGDDSFVDQRFIGLSLPMPVDRPDDVLGLSSEESRPEDAFRLFGFRRDMEVYFFVPLMLLLIGIPALAALWAGFALARVRAAATPVAGAAWGTLVGPVWATAIVILNALVQKEIFGNSVGDSVFTTSLFGGALLGALGGSLAVQSLKGGARQ